MIDRGGASGVQLFAQEVAHILDLGPTFSTATCSLCWDTPSFSHHPAARGVIETDQLAIGLARHAFILGHDLPLFVE